RADRAVSVRTAEMTGTGRSHGKQREERGGNARLTHPGRADFEKRRPLPRCRARNIRVKRNHRAKLLLDACPLSLYNDSTPFVNPREYRNAIPEGSRSLPCESAPIQEFAPL